MTVEFEGTAHAYYRRALEHAAHGSEDESRRLLAAANAIDRAEELSASELALIECCLALRRRDAQAARTAAETVSTSQEESEWLRRLLDDPRSMLPPESMSVIGDLVPSHETAGARSSGRRRSRGWAVVASSVVACGVLIVAGLWLVYRGNASSVTAPAYSRMQDVVGLLVIRVNVVTETEREGVWLPLPSGTAFAITQDGLLLTNRHVIEAGQALVAEYDEIIGWDVVVIFPSDVESMLAEIDAEAVAAAAGGDDTEMNSDSSDTDQSPNGARAKSREYPWTPARVVHLSVYRDVAVIRVDRRFRDPLRFSPSFAPGDSVLAYGYPDAASELAAHLSPVRERLRRIAVIDELLEGRIAPHDEWINPDDLVLNVTQGVISAVRNTEAGQMVQTNAPIYPGNSGGPLVDTRGRVVGIATLRHADHEGVNMAVGWESLRDDIGHIAGIRWPR